MWEAGRPTFFFFFNPGVLWNQNWVREWCRYLRASCSFLGFACVSKSGVNAWRMMQSEEQPCAQPHRNIPTMLMKWKRSTCSAAVSTKPKAAGNEEMKCVSDDLSASPRHSQGVIDRWRERGDSLVVGRGDSLARLVFNALLLSSNVSTLNDSDLSAQVHWWFHFC